MEEKKSGVAGIIIVVVSMLGLFAIIYGAWHMIHQGRTMRLPVGTTALYILFIVGWLIQEFAFIPYFLKKKERCLPYMYDGIDVEDDGKNYMYYVPFFGENMQMANDVKIELIIKISGYVAWISLILWAVLSFTKFEFLHDIFGGFAFTIYNEKAWLIPIWLILLLIPKGIYYCIDLWTQTAFFDTNFNLDEGIMSKGAILLSYLSAFVPILRIVYYYLAGMQYGSLYNEIMNTSSVNERFEDDESMTTSHFE